MMAGNGRIALDPRRAALTTLIVAAFLALAGATAVAQTTTPADTAAPSHDALFDDAKAPAEADDPKTLPKTGGFVQTEFARTVASPVHWSKMMLRADVGGQGAFTDQVKWKLRARLDYDAVFDATNTYPDPVRRDQRINLMLRETYLDFGAGDWDFRIGRQQVIWGEMVGLFFADVVSAKDLREFILPEFDVLRIPQWTARAEISKGDLHGEFIWIPLPSYDEIGKPGAEFFPSQPSAPPGFATRYGDEVLPRRTLANTNFGARVSALRNGWDVAAFYYHSMDAAAAFRRDIETGPTPGWIYTAQHGRINQFGGTLAKDFETMVLKAEAVYTRGRQVETQSPTDADGLVSQNILDWVVGLEFLLPTSAETRLNLQGFQRAHLNHDADIIPARHENGYSIYLNSKLTDRFEAQVLWISSFNRDDWLARPRVAWNFVKDWRAVAGVDIFYGPANGLFGRYGNRDRVYAELRYSF